MTGDDIFWFGSMKTLPQRSLVLYYDYIQKYFHLQVVAKFADFWLGCIQIGPIISKQVQFEWRPIKKFPKKMTN